jgi:hypothetical protein
VNIDITQYTHKEISLQVLKRLRTGLCDKYTMQAFGKRNVQAAEEVCRQCTKWIRIEDMKSWRDHTGPLVKIIIKRSDLFCAAFARQKIKATKTRTKRERQEENEKRTAELIKKLHNPDIVVAVSDRVSKTE